MGMDMRLALRPYLLAGVAIAGASVAVLAATAPRLPDVQVPAVQPAGTQVDDFNVQILQDLLNDPQSAVLVPEVGPGAGPEVVNPPDGLPGPSQVPDSLNAPPNLGLELNGLNGAMPSLSITPNLLPSDLPPGQ